MQDSDRIATLESRIAFQEAALDTLSDVIARQDRRLMEQEKVLKQVLQQLRSKDQLSSLEDTNEPPPHY